jgi:sugar phosphate isomerase/epimerase
MRLGIFAKTFEGCEPSGVLAAARAAGYVAVQYNMACSGLASMPEETAPETADAVRAAAREQQVEIASLSATYNMAHPDEAVRRRGLVSLRVLAEAARRMAAPLLTLCTGSRDAVDQWRFHPDNSSAESWAVLCESMSAALGIADEFGVDLGIEPELANVVSSARLARRLIDEMRSPRLRVVLDAANLFEVETLERQREIVSAGVDLLAGDISLAHAKDRLADGRFATAGTGVLDYPHYFGCLKKAGFAGVLVTHGLTAEEAPGVARFLGSQL